MVVNDIQNKNNQDVVDEHPMPCTELEGIRCCIHLTYKQELHKIGEQF